MDKLFLNNKLIDGSSVEMPVLSRGFAFGYGVFETMKFIDRRPCFFGEHLQRLIEAAKGARLEVTIDEKKLRAQAVQLFEVLAVDSGVFKIVITDKEGETSLAMFVRSSGFSGDEAPSRVCSSAVVKSSQAFTSRHKSLNYMESLLELEKAKDSGFDECLFRNEFGQLTECSVANIFMVSGNVLKTPALECGLLDGIVRRKVIELANDLGLSTEEGLYSEVDMLAADEAFLTSSGKGPRSVGFFVSSDGRTARYQQSYLPKIREAYLKWEREEAASHD